MDELTEQMNSSSLTKDFWVEEDFRYMSDFLKKSPQTELSQMDFENIISMCQVSKSKRSEDLAKAYDFINSKNGYILLFQYVKEWLPYPNNTQWKQIVKLNSYYLNSVYYQIYA